MYIYNFLIHLSTIGHLDYFHLLVILLGATMDIGVHVSIRINILGVDAKKWNY